jgi:hypothetical protein
MLEAQQWAYGMKVTLVVAVLMGTAWAQLGQVTVSSTFVPGQGHYQTVEFPGYYAVKLGDGSAESDGADFHGLIGFWDLKNDPAKSYNLAGVNAGLLEHQWGLINRDGSTRFGEYKESPGTLTILEHNNVRVRIKYHFAQMRYGDPRYPDNQNGAVPGAVTVDEYFTLYRDDAGAMAGAKIYLTFKMSYGNEDGKAPLSFGGDNRWQLDPKVTWIHFDNEGRGLFNDWWDRSKNPCQSPRGQPKYEPVTPSPWLVDTGSAGTYILYSARSHLSNAGPPAGEYGCAPAPTPGIVSVCTPTAPMWCQGRPRISGYVHVYSNFLNINENVGTYETGVYFMGLRTRLLEPNCRNCVPRGVDVFVRHNVMFAGPNGIMSAAVADEYDNEFRHPPSLKMATGTNGGFSKEEGIYALTASANAVKFVLAGKLHSPAFKVSSWTAETPAKIRVGGSALNLGTDYVAVADSRTQTLLVQILRTVGKGAEVQVPDSTAATPSASPADAAPTGGYTSRTDTTVVAESKPKLCFPAPCNMTVTDMNPAGVTYTRVTDARTRPDRLGRVFSSLDSSEQVEWNSDTTGFVAQGTGGELVPFTFNAADQTVARIPCNYIGTDCNPDGGGLGSGGLLINDIGADAAYSFEYPTVLYGTGSDKPVTIKKVDYNTTLSKPSKAPRVLTIATFSTRKDCPGVPTGPGRRGLSISGDDSRMMTWFGGTSQDLDHIVVVWDDVTKKCRWYDTSTGMMGGNWPGAPTGAIAYHDEYGTLIKTVFHSAIHNARISKDGNLVRISVQDRIDIWDVATNNVYRCSGHSPSWIQGHVVLGFDGTFIDSHGNLNGWMAKRTVPPCGPYTDSLLLVRADLAQGVPKGFSGLDDHQNWNNAVKGQNDKPLIVSVLGPIKSRPTMAWQWEIVGVATDGSGKVWRFGHTFSRGHDFYAQGHVNASRDGRWALFTSDWGTGRSDLYLIPLK